MAQRVSVSLGDESYTRLQQLCKREDSVTVSEMARRAIVRGLRELSLEVG